MGIRVRVRVAIILTVLYVVTFPSYVLNIHHLLQFRKYNVQLHFKYSMNILPNIIDVDDKNPKRVHHSPGFYIPTRISPSPKKKRGVFCDNGDVEFL